MFRRRCGSPLPHQMSANIFYIFITATGSKVCEQHSTMYPLKTGILKKLLWPVLVLLSIFHSHAQPSVVDSLRKAIHQAPDDSSKVQLYYEYGKHFETSDPDTALWYYARAKERAKELNFLPGVASYASHAIVILNNQGKFREALELTKEALSLYQKIGSPRDLSVAYLNVGSEWHYLSDFQLATENYLEARKLAEAVGDKRLQRIVNNNLASIFINLQEYEKGKNYAEQSLELAKEMKNDYAISSSTFNIATAELYLKQYDNALRHYQEIESIGARTDDFTIKLDGWLGQADVYNAIPQPASAEKYYQQVISLSKEKNAPEYEMYAYMGLADLFMKINRNREAEQVILNGIAIAQKLGSNYELKDLYLKASSLKEKTGNFSDALKFRKQFEVLNDSIVGEKSKEHITLLEARFESEKKESTIKQLEADKQIQELSLRQKSILNYILIGSAIMLLAITLLSFRTYKQKQKLQQQRITELEKEKQLMAAEAVLKGEEQERTRLAKDLHDGLGGMLSGIKYAFSNMKGNLVMTPENHQAFEHSMNMLDSSIKEMRRVAHNMMPESLVKFGLDEALRDFCNDINQSGALKVTYQSMNLAGVSLDQTTSITLYRIVQELLSNTLKHAEARTAIVQLTKTDNRILVTVEDDGKGFDTAVTRQTKGIGWSNIQHRVDFLKGKLDVDSQPGKGTSVHIELDI
ncbi:MAG TPA: tetratricopeptide repeat protein [Ohtaekwangia sp.]